MLVNGEWKDDWRPPETTGEAGAFVRQLSSFRGWITPDGSSGPAGQKAFPAEAKRYHLYVALSCPWASRTLIARKLKGLEDSITVTVMDPVLSKQGWRFRADVDPNPFSQADYLHQVYTNADPHYTGRVTVPVLYDAEQGTIVNNESADILRVLDSGFGPLARSDVQLYPQELRTEIDALNERLYSRLNDGVYRAGFATGQTAYEEAFRDVFGMLDELEDRLAAGGPYLFGDRFTEADIRFFVTLIRFDAAYYGLFKCNLRRIADYSALSAYLGRVFALPGVGETVDIEAIKRGYYSVKALNPTGIVPLGPDLPFSR